MSLDDHPFVPLLFGPSPVHRLERLGAELGGTVEIWTKREDCNSGLAYGGNKVRKLEYLARMRSHRAATRSSRSAASSPTIRGKLQRSRRGSSGRRLDGQP